MLKCIEFMGSPGAGKTTICKTICDDKRFVSLNEALWLSMKNNLSDRFWKRIFLFVPSFIGKKKSRSTFLKTADYLQSLENFKFKNLDLFNLCNARAEKSENSMIKNQFSRFLSSYQFISKHLENKTLVLDHGFAQNAISLFAYDDFIDQRQLENYFHQIPIPDIVCIIVADKYTYLKRINQRERGKPIRMRNLSNEKTLNFYSNCDKVIKSASSILKERGAKIILVENNGELDAALQKIRDNTKSLVF